MKRSRRRRGSPTVSEFIPVYLDHVRLRKSTGWVKSQRIYLRTHVEPVWGKRRLGGITPAMIEEFIEQWAATAKATTINKRLSCLRSFFAYAEDQGLVRRNVARLVERLPDDTRLHDDILSREEFARLVGCAGPKLRMFLFLAYHTGVRCGEATALRWQDIDLANRMIRVSGEKAGGNTRIAIRWVPINDELLRELRDYRTFPEGQHTHLFEHRGRPRWSSLNTTFRSAVQRAGFQPGRWITPHTLRHTFGSEMAMAGVPMRKLQLLLGHSTVLTTERWYAHHSPDYLKGATDVLFTPAEPPPSDKRRGRG